MESSLADIHCHLLSHLALLAMHLQVPEPARKRSYLNIRVLWMWLCLFCEIKKKSMSREEQNFEIKAVSSAEILVQYQYTKLYSVTFQKISILILAAQITSCHKVPLRRIFLWVSLGVLLLSCSCLICYWIIDINIICLYTGRVSVLTLVMDILSREWTSLQLNTPLIPCR
jgi:hypothetical protein